VRGVFSQPGLLLRVSGLLTQFPRTAAGLRCLLSDRAGAPVKVIQCVSRTVPIPPDQRCHLGEDSAQLGESAWIGLQAQDDTGKFRIEVGPLTAATFAQVIPGGGWHAAIVRLVLIALAIIIVRLRRPRGRGPAPDHGKSLQAK
jgi:type VI secretion system protein ImpH